MVMPRAAGPSKAVTLHFENVPMGSPHVTCVDASWSNIIHQSYSQKSSKIFFHLKKKRSVSTSLNLDGEVYN